jgi:6-phosphogluconolactonase
VSKTIMYVGCRNRLAGPGDTARGEGISGFTFDPATGRLAPLNTTLGIDNPTFLAISADQRHLYATSEVVGWNEGTVTAYAIDPSSGALAYINKQPSRGSLPAQLSFDAAGRYLLAINYSIGSMAQRPNQSVVVFPRAADGELLPPVAEVSHIGHGPDQARQERPHPHCVRTTPDDRFAVVADLGLDRLAVYRFNATTGKIEPHSEAPLPPGSGPRHFTFHPKLPLVYVANELNSTLATLSFDTANGSLSLRSVNSTLPEGPAPGANSCSEIAFAPDVRHLYVGNRGHDSLTCFAIDETDGCATLASITPSGGRTPRHFSFDPSGSFLAVANQDDDCIAVFTVEHRTGELRLVSSVIYSGTPTCIAFAVLP